MVGVDGRCIAESVMLQFAHSDAPALPIHDSFVMHHGYGGIYMCIHL